MPAGRRFEPRTETIAVAAWSGKIVGLNDDGEIDAEPATGLTCRTKGWRTASIDKRDTKTDVRYRDPEHRTQKKTFANLSDARRFASTIEADKARGPARCRSPGPTRRRSCPGRSRGFHLVHDAMPERYRVAVTLGAGLGRRQGEIFGLAVDDVDFLRGVVTVRRQVRMHADGRLEFALPKGRKVRTVPLAGSVRDELAAHLATRPAVRVAQPGEGSRYRSCSPPGTARRWLAPTSTATSGSEH